MIDTDALTAGSVQNLIKKIGQQDAEIHRLNKLVQQLHANNKNMIDVNSNLMYNIHRLDAIIQFLSNDIANLKHLIQLNNNQSNKL